jgi:hypothetical protein
MTDQTSTPTSTSKSISTKLVRLNARKTKTRSGLVCHYFNQEQMEADESNATPCCAWVRLTDAMIALGKNEEEAIDALGLVTVNTKGLPWVRIRSDNTLVFGHGKPKDHEPRDYGFDFFVPFKAVRDQIKRMTGSR